MQGWIRVIQCFTGLRLRGYYPNDGASNGKNMETGMENGIYVEVCVACNVEAEISTNCKYRFGAI